MTSVKQLLHDRFSDQIDDPTAMIEAYERHNATVRGQVPVAQLLEWSPADGWAAHTASDWPFPYRMPLFR